MTNIMIYLSDIIMTLKTTNFVSGKFEALYIEIKRLFYIWV